MPKKINIYAPFVAIDFETANYKPNSACALALVRVENGIIVDKRVELIRPPEPEFAFTYLHGISWDDVAGKPTFGELWPQIAEFLKGVKFLAAHNADFDKGVLRACCLEAGLTPPRLRFLLHHENGPGKMACLSHRPGRGLQEIRYPFKSSRSVV